MNLSLLAYNINVYIENPKNLQKATLINGFSKVIEYKINIEKSIYFSM